MATIVTRSDAPWAFLPTLKEITEKAMDGPALWRRIADVKGVDEVSNDKRGIITAFMTGIGPLQVWGETLPIPYDTPNPGRIKVTAFADFGVRVAISRNAMEDDINGVYGNIGKGFPRSHQLFRDLLMGRLLNNAFATTYYTDDSETPRAILATNHASVNGASRANTFSTGQALSYQALIDMMVLMMRHNSEIGYPEPLLEEGQRMLLVVAPEDYPLALKLTSELSQYNPTNNDNDPNLVKLMSTLVPVANPYLSSVGTGNYWFLIPENDKGIWIVERRAPEISNWVDPNTKSMHVDMTCREAVHVNDVWRIWGSGQ